MTRIFTIFLVCSLSWQAHASEIKIVCEDKSDGAAFYRKSSPTIGIEIYLLGADKGTIKQLAGELKEKNILSAKINEAEIRFEQAGYINEPKIIETFQTTISRVSGNWIRYPHYVNADGRWVTGDALEQLARSLSLWGALGIRQRPDEGNCQVDTRRF